MALMDQTAAWGFFRPLLWEHIAVVVAVFLVARAAAFAARAGLRRAAERARPQWRLTILRLIPLSRLALAVLAVIVAVPILVEPTLRNVVALAASVGLGLAFALKDYASSLVAGIVTVLENAYQPG